MTELSTEQFFFSSLNSTLRYVAKGNFLVRLRSIFIYLTTIFKKSGGSVRYCLTTQTVNQLKKKNNSHDFLSIPERTLSKIRLGKNNNFCEMVLRFAHFRNSGGVLYISTVR